MIDKKFNNLFLKNLLKDSFFYKIFMTIVLMI